MKTKCILHGGMLSQGGPNNAAFFEAFTRELAEGDTVLWIGFARQQGSDREETFIRDTRYIQAATKKTLTFVNATVESLPQQLEAATAVFVTGGSSHVLIETMSQYPEFTNLLAGKTYAGSSAGACLVSTYYYHCSQQKISAGLGILPIRLMVHYGNSDFNATMETLAELEQHHPELELVVLPECQWQTTDIEL